MGIFRRGDRAFALIPGPIYVRTTLAGLGLGTLAVLLPLTRYFGHEELDSVLTANFGAVFLLTLALGKMAAVNAAVTRTPISTTLLLSKLTNLSPFTPILFASLVGFFLALKFLRSHLNSNPREKLRIGQLPELAAQAIKSNIC